MKRATFLVLMLACPTLLAEKPVNTGLFGKTAIKGYDPVAYFRESKPTKGSEDFTVEWKGAEWRFVSAKNREDFQTDPAKYAPQYGGYCAWAVSQGYTAGIDPDAWKIVEGKLYLNYDRSVQEKWQKDIPGLIRKADENWPKILAK
jgi:YHS domain-containing protein